MADNGPPPAPAAQPGFSTLPEDLLEKLAEYFTADCSPVYDNGDLLHQASTLACVGNASFTFLAHTIFTFLSPRLSARARRGWSVALAWAEEWHAILPLQERMQLRADFLCWLVHLLQGRRCRAA